MGGQREIERVNDKQKEGWEKEKGGQMCMYPISQTITSSHIFSEK